MIPISAQNAAEFAGGRLIGCESTITYITTDSRKAAEGCLFAAIKGEKFDGHSFIEKAWHDGAVCVLSSENIDVPEGKGLILVDDTRKALLKLAGGYRDMFDIPVTEVTGSVGKTTTKDIIAGVLSEKYNVLKTNGNFNNDIGVPITLFSLEKEHTAAVVETGMNHKGEIDVLAKEVKPNVGVITNVGVSHIENLGSREGILRAKCEMFPYIKSGGFAVLNADDDMLSTIEGREAEYGLPDDVNIMWYGTNDDCDIWADGIELLGIDGVKCTIHTPKGSFDVTISVPGKHMVYNAMAAAAVGIIDGMETEDIKRGLEGFVPTGMRMERFKLSDGSTLIDDSYNANPVSTKAAIDVLASCDGPKCAVLGDMFELGEFSDKMHYDVGAYAAQKGIDRIIAIGGASRNIYDAAVAEGAENAEYYGTVEDFLASGFGFEGTTLIKASHSMHFNKIAEYMKQK
ncbi:MAG: UDP-N-acetylmuramoyl-tripeptide--D-alanyl-D-alanine ligase [Clostridia bacterium]|nr:UDP-N-acetylmuramoyl-tripeptide--D-alanyl-D-alanine ligase [Clostridia bacterium]